jgi:hypothetical protein
MALHVILCLDVAQENWALSLEEIDLRKRLKRRVISLAVLDRSRKRQCTCICFLKDGDANTKFFHALVNGRRRKNFIQRIAHNQGWVTDHNGKESLIKTHFSAVMGKGPPCPRDFNWAGMSFPPLDLEDLGESFSELEVFAAIKSMPSDKAPGPDGFMGAFYKTYWQTIKHDIMRVIHLFSNLHAENFHWLNSANVVLIPKKEGRRPFRTSAQLA